MDTNGPESQSQPSNGSLFVNIRSIRGQKSPFGCFHHRPRPLQEQPLDRNLIAPCPDHHWKVSSILDPRLSNGEKELLDLAGKSLLLPKDEALHPDTEGLKWKSERLAGAALT